VDDAVRVSPIRACAHGGSRLEELGYGALWFGEGVWCETLTEAALLLGSSQKMVIATGITSIWGRDYLRNWRRLGFTDADFADGGSDRLVDALVIADDVQRIVEQLSALITRPAPMYACRCLMPGSPAHHSAPGRSLQPRSSR
jgi:hypothetical protein